MSLYNIQYPLFVHLRQQSIIDYILRIVGNDWCSNLLWGFCFWCMFVTQKGIPSYDRRFIKKKKKITLLLNSYMECITTSTIKLSVHSIYINNAQCIRAVNWLYLAIASACRRNCKVGHQAIRCLYVGCLVCILLQKITKIELKTVKYISQQMIKKILWND